jgi:hypothetical protein
MGIYSAFLVARVGLSSKKRNCGKILLGFYLLKCKELLVLHLHHTSRDVVVPETLPELDPSESVAVPSWVGLPPIELGTLDSLRSVLRT